ncbi:alcohol dehydrogenase [Alicyclobacillus cellulosilyticus]|uniref:Alcohol dehydrogenase n=1 Tax=Alicyclobacillus cellulosilyticus TaxID=1003997 RepID=A0A917K3Z6_9BACL|nr:zinc-binding dehydrogenase [Alicyclobacillus cellulosilyticus]GGI99141.1 alcohol dehydrogenase [Alicyclobacillus cellulosilyticus]
MYGVVLPGHERVEIREFDVPQPGVGQVLVKMKASGLCGSDLRAIYREHVGVGAERYQNVIAGHEPSGQIEEVGPGVTGFRRGDRVIVYHIAGCGYCRECRRGHMISCSSPERAAYGWQRDGGHADYLLAEARTLIRLPDELSYVDGALIACGFGTAYQGVLRAGISGRDRVLVVGLGPLGLAAVMLSMASGAEVIAVDLVPERLALARRIGAQHTLPADGQTLEQIMALTRGKGTEVAIDCSGSPQGRLLCLQAARERGRVVYLGEGGTVTFEPSPLLLHKRLTLYGSWVCGLAEMEELAEHLVRKGLHPEDIVTHRFALTEADQAYKTFASGKCGKVVLTWD